MKAIIRVGFLLLASQCLSDARHHHHRLLQPKKYDQNAVRAFYLGYQQRGAEGVFDTFNEMSEQEQDNLCPSLVTAGWPVAHQFLTDPARLAEFKQTLASRGFVEPDFPNLKVIHKIAYQWVRESHPLYAQFMEH